MSTGQHVCVITPHVHADPPAEKASNQQTTRRCIAHTNMASPLQQDRRGPWTALHEAANNGLSSRVRRIVLGGSTEINVGSPQGYTPLMLAADGGYIPIVRFLLDKGAITTVVGDEGVTALHVSAKNGHVSVSKMLLEAGADVGFASYSTGGYTPLHIAAQRGNWQVIEVLIKAGANVDDCLTDGATALYLAAEKAHLGAVKILLQNKAQLSLATEQGATPVVVAADWGHVDIVREIIKWGGMEISNSVQGQVALRMASQQGHLEIAMALHAAGVEDDDGLALCGAIMHGGKDMLKFLLRCSKDVQRCACLGAYVNSANGIIGKPLLHCFVPTCIRVNSRRVMRLLIDAGADTTFTFNHVDDYGKFIRQTTLSEMVSTLIAERGSDGIRFTKQQIRVLEGMRALLLQTAAIRDISWGWPHTGGAAGAVAAPSLLVPVRKESAARKKRVSTKALLR
jgi:ankyrin repeat protein